MRLAVVLLCTAMAAGSFAQGISQGLESVVRTLKEKELLPIPAQIPGTQPQINDPSTRAGQLPRQDIDPSRQELRYDGNVTWDGPNFTLTDGAHITYRGYEIYADRIEGNTESKIVKGIGHVRVFGVDAYVRGDEVTVNLRNETFLARDSFVDARPSLLGGYVQRNLYIKGGEAYGSRNEILGEKCDVTSCDLTSPHYHLSAAKVTVRPGKRAIFRKVSVILFRKTIFKLPYLSIPLDDRSYKYLPEIGQTFDEGYYVKFKFGIPLKSDYNFLDTHVDYYTKKGPGLGFDFNYSNPDMRGVVSAYSILGSDRTLTVNSRHRQDLGFGILTLDNNFQQNNYMSAPEARILNTRIGLYMPQGRMTSTRFDLLRNDNNSGGSHSTSETYKISDVRRWTPTIRTNFDIGYSKSSSSSGSFSTQREQLDVRLRAEKDLEKATAQFDYQRAIPIGETSGFFSGSDRTPVLSLLTDSRRLFGRGKNFPIPFTSELSIGEFANSLDKNRVSRANFDLNISKPDRSRNRLRLDVNGRFKQGAYSDGTAQYILGLGLQATYSLGYDTSLNIRYNYMRPYGFSPLQIDRPGRSNSLTGDLSFRPFKSMLLGVQTGYDILQLQNELADPKVAWQSLSARMEYRPTDYISLRGLSTYDSVLGSWSNLRFDLAYRPGATFVGLGAKYDGIRKSWSSVSGFVDGFKWGRLRTSFLFDYNGYLKRFESRHVQFTYDLHCAEAVLTVIDNPIGFRSGTSINFFLRIKAFPFNTGFGTGTSGQPIGIGY